MHRLYPHRRRLLFVQFLPSRAPALRRLELGRCAVLPHRLLLPAGGLAPVRGLDRRRGGALLAQLPPRRPPALTGLDAQRGRAFAD